MYVFDAMTAAITGLVVPGLGGNNRWAPGSCPALITDRSRHPPDRVVHSMTTEPTIMKHLAEGCAQRMTLYQNCATWYLSCGR